MLCTIALWWCYVTGGLFAIAITGITAWWAFDVIATRIGWTRQILEWRYEKAKTYAQTAL